MDVEVLLVLQELREAAGPVLEHAAALVTEFGSGTLCLVAVLVVYWAVDKRLGASLALSFGIGSLAVQALKVTVCCYRPWVRDPRVVPSELAVDGATGYSFPSGHSQQAASVWGGVAAGGRGPAWLRVAPWALVALVGLSRCLLGVHTPQDVLAGLAVGVASVWAGRALWRAVEDEPSRDLAVALAGALAAAGLVAYALLRPYPVDRVGGGLLVDPVEMQTDCFRAAGIVLGTLAGWLGERRLVDFDTDAAPAALRAWRVAAGVACLLAVVLVVQPALIGALGERWGYLATYVVVGLAGMLGAPAAVEAAWYAARRRRAGR